MIKNGYSPTEVMLGLTSMRVELGLERIEQLESLVVDQLQKYILPPMRMETRLILKSLGVKFTTVKLQKNSSKIAANKELSLLPTKGMTRTKSGK